MNDLPRFGIQIQVNDLDSCRIFYRDLLELGEPVFDSTFQVIFQLGEDLTLTLEQSGAEYLEHASAPILWSFCCADIDALRERLGNAGYDVKIEANRHDSGSCFTGEDPEGNRFLIRPAGVFPG